MTMAKSKKQATLIRAGTYKVEEILSLVQFTTKAEGKANKVDFDGDLINMTSDRYKLFASKGCVCCSCGLEGTFFAKERHRCDVTSHLNLYGIDEDGNEILFTKDHIIPRCSGGRDHHDNYQVMCTVCNGIKADASALNLRNGFYGEYSDAWPYRALSQILDHRIVCHDTKSVRKRIHRIQQLYVGQIPPRML